MDKCYKVDCIYYDKKEDNFCCFVKDINLCANRVTEENINVKILMEINNEKN